MFNMSPEKFSEIADNLDPVKPLHVGWISFINNILTIFFLDCLIQESNLKFSILYNMGHIIIYTCSGTHVPFVRYCFSTNCTVL